MDSEAAAKGYLRVSQAKNPDFFAEAPAVIVPVKLGRRTLYRVVAGGAPSRAAASVICRKLRKSQPNAFCKVVAN
jgi:SPOR domain